MPGFTLLPAAEAPLDEELTAQWHRKDPSHYTHIQTFGERAGLGEDRIRELQARYADEFARHGVFISTPDQVPGYRRVVKFDPAWNATLMGQGNHVLIAVDDRGFMSSKVMPVEQGPHPSVMEMLDRGEPWGGEWGSPTGLEELNRFAREYRQFPKTLAKRFWWAMVEEGPDEHNPLPKEFANPVRGMISARIAKAHRLAAWALMDALDPDIRRHMRGTHQTKVSDALWLSGNDKPASPDNARILSRNRLQASRAYPILSPWFRKEHLQKVIDNGEPLAPALQEEFDLNRFALRHLTGVSWQKLGLGFRADIHWIVRAAKMAAGWGGLSRENNRHLHELDEISSKFHVTFEEAMQKARPILSDPERARPRLLKLADASDMVDHLIDKLYVPAGLNGLRDILQARPGPADAAEITWVHSDHSPYPLDLHTHGLRAAFHSMSLKDMLEASGRWHRNLIAHDDRVTTLRTGTAWRPLIGDVDCENGTLGRELCSSDALSLQGRLEGHCVGGYDRRVVNSNPQGVTLIFSIENAGEVLGTLEVSGRTSRESEDTEPGLVFSNAQLRGKNNSSVGAEAEEAAAKIIGMLNRLPTPGIASYLDDLRDAARARRGQAELDGALRKAKYDFWNRQELKTAWDELSVYLPRATRKAGLDQFIRDCGKILLPSLEKGYGYNGLSAREDGVFEETARDGTVIKMGIRPFWETDQALVARFRAGEDMQIWRFHTLSHKMNELAQEHGGLERLNVAPKGDPDGLDEDFDEIPF